MTTYNPEEIKHLKYIWGTWNTLQFACSSKEIMWNWDFGRRAFFLTYKDKKIMVFLISTGMYMNSAGFLV
jgi:hypothetical protein